MIEAVVLQSTSREMVFWDKIWNAEFRVLGNQLYKFDSDRFSGWIEKHAERHTNKWKDMMGT